MTKGPIAVAASDIDGMGHVNNSVYLRWIEAAVHDDWSVRSTASEFAMYRWIAVRHEVDYRRPAFIDERLEIGVRLTEVRRARAWYDTVITRSGTTIVEARSCWCCLDHGGRLTAIPPETANRILSGQRQPSV